MLSTIISNFSAAYGPPIQYHLVRTVLCPKMVLGAPSECPTTDSNMPDNLILTASTPILLASLFLFALRLTLLLAQHGNQTDREHGNSGCGPGSSADARQDNARRPPAAGVQGTTSSFSKSAGAGSRRHLNRKRPAGDGDSDNEDDDRGKRQETGPGQPEDPEEYKRRIPCPFSVRYPQNHKFQNCGTFEHWGRLREHLISTKRKHRPRDQCQICGNIYWDTAAWQAHTRARKCRKPSKPFEKVICVAEDQARSIKGLAKQGKKIEKPIEAMCRDVWDILFQGVRCTAWPYRNDHFEGEHADDLIGETHVLLGDQELVETVSDLPGMENVPPEERGRLAARCFAVVTRRLQALKDREPVDSTKGQPNTPACSGLQPTRSPDPNSPYSTARVDFFPNNSPRTGSWELYRRDPSEAGPSSSAGPIPDRPASASHQSGDFHIHGLDFDTWPNESIDPALLKATPTVPCPTQHSAPDDSFSALGFLDDDFTGSTVIFTPQ